jgi:hypothetical protein
MFKWIYFGVSLVVSCVYIGVSLYTISNEPLCTVRKHCVKSVLAIHDVLQTGAILSSISLIVFYTNVLVSLLFKKDMINKVALGVSLNTVIVSLFHGIIVYALHEYIFKWRGQDNQAYILYMATYILAFISSGIQPLWVIILININYIN